MSSSVKAIDGGVVRPFEIELTILMPCLNEAETLGACIRKAQTFLARKGVAGEVIVADNGSTDESQEIARQLAQVWCPSQRADTVRLFSAGLKLLEAYIVMGDADDSYEFSRLDAYLEKLREGADLVMGNRFQGGIPAGRCLPSIGISETQRSVSSADSSSSVPLAIFIVVSGLSTRMRCAH